MSPLTESICEWGALRPHPQTLYDEKVWTCVLDDWDSSSGIGMEQLGSPLAADQQQVLVKLPEIVNVAPFEVVVDPAGTALLVGHEALWYQLLSGRDARRLGARSC